MPRKEEVIIRSLRKKKELSLLEICRGLFAFLLADYRYNEPVLLAARDYLGAKPLYYVEDNNQLYFSSEMKSLINLKKEVRVFPPGHYYHSKKGFVGFDEVETIPDKN